MKTQKQDKYESNKRLKIDLSFFNKKHLHEMPFHCYNQDMKFFRGFFKEIQRSKFTPPDFFKSSAFSRRIFFKSFFFKLFLLFGSSFLIKKIKLFPNKDRNPQSPFQNLNISDLILPQAHAACVDGSFQPSRCVGPGTYCNYICVKGSWQTYSCINVQWCCGD